MRIAQLLGQLLEKLRSLLALRCECYSEQSYNEIVKELEDTIAKLEDWYKRATGGDIGTVVDETARTCEQS